MMSRFFQSLLVAHANAKEVRNHLNASSQILSQILVMKLQDIVIQSMWIPIHFEQTNRHERQRRTLVIWHIRDPYLLDLFIAPCFK